jgi:hypothetical protein
MPPAAGVRNLQIPLLPIPSGDFWRRRQRRRHSPIPYNPWGLWFSGFQYCDRIWRPSSRESKSKTLVSSHRQRAFWAFFAKTKSINSGNGYSLAIIKVILLVPDKSYRIKVYFQD